MKGNNFDANSLLGFTYGNDQEEQYYHQLAQEKKRRRQKPATYSACFTQQEYMQAAFRYVVRSAKAKEDYPAYLSDASKLVEWKDVVEAVYTPPSDKGRAEQKIVCPICLEALQEIVAPRVTKCGHIFCWPCLVRYLTYEQKQTWKKCPLCADPIMKKDVRRVRITPAPTSELTFQLMVRNKYNTSVKLHDEESKILGNRLPTVNMPSYGLSRIVTCEEEYVAQRVRDDLQILRQDLKLKQSCGEDDLLPYVVEAIDACESNLTWLSHPPLADEDD